VPKLLRRGFDSFSFLVGWTLWKERNARTFNRVAMTAAQFAVAIHDEATGWCLAGNRQLGALMSAM